MSSDNVITDLTPEQREQFEAKLKVWTEIGKRQDEVDIEKAIAAIQMCYEDAGMTMPETYYVFDSPMQAAISVAIMQDARWPELGALVENMYGLDLLMGKAYPADSVKPKVFSTEVQEVLKSKDLKVAAKLHARYKSEYEKGVASISQRSADQFWTKVELAIGAQNPGSHDAGWLAFYDFMGSDLGLKEETKLARGHIELAKHCGWWTAYENCFIMQHRHIRCCIDDQGRPHATDGMALEYRDGFGIWAIEGHKVDEQIVMKPETQTPADIDKENNADVRAIRLNRYPWKRYIGDTGAKIIDKRDNHVDGTKEALYRTKYGLRFFYTCPTGRLMSSSLPDTIETCEQAQFWLGGNRKRNVIAST